MTTRFIISQTGAVTVATVQSSTLGHSDTEACITQAVRRWAFPEQPPPLRAAKLLALP